MLYLGVTFHHLEFKPVLLHNLQNFNFDQKYLNIGIETQNGANCGNWLGYMPPQ